MAFPLAVVQGALMGVAVNAFTNVINDRSPFDNALQSLLLGGVSGGIFGGAEGAIPFGESTLAGNMSNLFGSGVAGGTTLVSGTGAAPAVTGAGQGLTSGISSGNDAVDIARNNIPAIDYGLGNTGAPAEGLKWNAYDIGPVGASAGYTLPPDFGKEVSAFNDVNLQDAPYESPGARINPAAPIISKVPPNYSIAPDSSSVVRAPNSPSAVVKKPSSSFMDDPFKWMNANKGKTALGGLGIAGAMGAFNRNTGLNNLPPRTYQRVNTSYNPGTVSENYGQPRQPYFVGQGYGPLTRETFSVAAGGGIRALSEGGYVPMPSRGFMSNKEEIPDSANDSASFIRYLKSDINKDEEKGQAEIDKTVMAWLERHAKADVKGMAEGGPAQQVTQFQPTFSPAQQDIGSLPYQAPDVPAMESSPAPQYQMNGFSGSSMFQPTGGGAANPMTAGLGSYLEGLEYKAPPVASPVASPVTSPVAPPVASSISGPPSWAPTPTLYNPATQSYSDNPAFTAPVAKDSGSDTGYFYDNEGNRRSVYDEDGNRRYNDDGSSLYDGGEKAGGPIASKRYAMGGLAALPEYAAGGKLLDGPGDGMSDGIPAVIKGATPQRAALADGEFVIPADVVSHLGNGSTKAGGKRLYEMMANIRKARTGNPKQGKQINPMKFMPT